MAKVIMVQGTMSNAGKSFLVAGLCRIFRQDGYSVAPFKSQNMALNSFITEDGLEMGRAQVMQAEAAGIKPVVQMNPILLNPTTEHKRQVIVNGEILDTMGGASYFEYKKNLLGLIKDAYDTLAEQYDIIVIEGAGSPVEMNLKKNDIVNMGMAKLVHAPVLLAGDIERGGVFAQLVGTMELFDKEERNMVKGLLINKFRGNMNNFGEGSAFLEEKTGVPVLGLIPYMDVAIEDEDSLAVNSAGKNNICPVDIAIIKIPHISNFTDFNALEIINNVSVRYVENVRELKNPDMILLPGSKNTMGDLLWMRQCGLEAAVLKQAAKGKIIFGICGGFQMLGETISDPEETEQGGTIKGMGLLPVDTVFRGDKTRTRVTGKFTIESGDLEKLSGVPLEGYEIHMGESVLRKDAEPFSVIRDEITGKEKHDGAHKGNVFGSYVHGIFDGGNIVNTIVLSLAEKKGVDLSEMENINYEEFKQQQYDKLADEVRANIDMNKIYEILEEGVK